MIQLNASFLKSVGLFGIPSSIANMALAATYTALEARTGLRLAAQMSSDMLSEFDAFLEADDEAGALAWLERHFPAYRTEIHDELSEIRAALVLDAATLRQLLGQSL